jgi:8-amino-7-oxononanoate synthase
MKRKGAQGLTGQLKEQLIKQAVERRIRRAERDRVEPTGASSVRPLKANSAHDWQAEEYRRFDKHPSYQQLQIVKEGARKLGIEDPYFRIHSRVAGRTTQIEGCEYLNFASYNYLGLCGDAEVNQAAIAAIQRYGTSVSASRPVSGERGVHRDLERALAALHDVEDSVVFVSGHATNVTAIGCLLGAKDLAVHDALIHNSAMLGMQLSGAHRRSFAHNDLDALEALLSSERHHYQRALIVVEGIYSMDGDFPDLPRLVEIKERFNAILMVDEAHSLGVMGSAGLGIREHFGLAGNQVDIWMGTLSKALASCGGYIAGSAPLVELLKFASPGFLYSVGIAPPNAAAALAALEKLHAHPERVACLQARGLQFLARARAAGIDTGCSAGFAVIPAVTGSSIKAGRLANALFERGINVQPIIYPAVEEKAARLRFFVSAAHTESDIDTAVKQLADAWHAL